MKLGFGWLTPLLTPVLGIQAAGEGGGAAAGADAKANAATETPGTGLQAPVDQPRSESPMTMGGRQYTAEEVRELTKAPGEKKDGTDVAAKPAAGEGAGNPAAEGMIPRERYNEGMRRKDAMLRAAGIDPETGNPIAKTETAQAAAKPQEFAKGQEPWAKDLVALPRQDDRDAQGNEKYADTASFLEALADAKAHNKVVEQFGKRAVADQAAQVERDKQSQVTRDNQAVHKFTSESVPAALVKRGLLKEGALPQEIGPAFDAALAPLMKLPQMERESGYLYNFAIKNSESKADLLLAVAEEAKTPEGVAHLMKLGALGDNALINELIAMDRLVSLGLTIRGKPRAGNGGNGSGNGAGGAAQKELTGGNGGSNGGSDGIDPSPRNGASGAAVDGSSLTGAALFAQLDAERNARNKAVMDRQARRKN